ncbi:histidine phosphatase family protein [Aspergillus saccharolyticus JOP 1030-1]|uniref:3-phytase n=1 Tax=Aspergillus saccharolyticus JOP 1030-1 TaxID=1450539 RepID=A0A318ZKT3_9EURO|nr:3-phytase B precursor [Aspergillus saccharolyticus JOP 1030-1]PYH47385.1 3-phytase B precursor [Aspergillus saccharolyticus JOP 1030-1]
MIPSLVVISISTLILTPAATATTLSSTFPSTRIAQQVFDGDNFLKYDGIRGPYVDRKSYGISRDPPPQCTVDQVVMVKRHGERYPASGEGPSIEVALKKVNSTVQSLESGKGDLDFLRGNWTYYVPSDCYEAETFTGPYAGLAEAYSHGQQYRARYAHLWTNNSSSSSAPLVLPLFAAEYQRIIDTARRFGEGFVGEENYSTQAAMNLVSESSSRGADSLTPSCHQDDSTARDKCNAYPYRLPQFDAAAERLNAQYKGLNLSWSDVVTLMTMAAYELNARSESKWIDVFTTDEWVSFSYIWDVNFYYCAGPGNKYIRAVGANYLSASLSLLQQGPSAAGSLFFNFAHDSNISPIIAALDIANPPQDLPTDRVAFDLQQHWRITDIIPMGGRLTIERLNCSAGSALGAAGIYVRLVLNEAVVPLRSCQDGPGYSCSLQRYAEFVQGLPVFADECAVPPDEPQHLDFWWNYTTSSKENWHRGERCNGLA